MPENWLYRIRNNNVTPPVYMWEHIANELENTSQSENKLQQNLLALEINPPQELMENIFQKLDAESEFANRISSYEVQPPANTWNNLADILNTEGKVIPLNNRKKWSSSFLKYAAVFAIVIMAAVFFYTRKVNQQETVAGNQLHSQTSTAKLNDVNTNKEINTGSKEVSSPNQKKTFIVKPPKTSVKQNLDNVSITDAAIANVSTSDLSGNPLLQPEKLLDSHGNIPSDISLISIPNAYISVTGPDGQTIKWSSKFSGIIQFINNNQQPDTKENIDIIIEESAKWKAIFTRWREKMNNTAITPSINNFMDIIELSNTLEEKK